MSLAPTRRGRPDVQRDQDARYWAHAHATEDSQATSSPHAGGAHRADRRGGDGSGEPSWLLRAVPAGGRRCSRPHPARPRSEEHTSELQSRFDLVCRLLLEKKNNYYTRVAG